MLATLPLLEKTDFPPLRRTELRILQVNLGYKCNQQCLHCHVNAGPKRPETMSGRTVDEVIEFLETGRASELDITGGAPELNPHFRRLVSAARKLGLSVIDRCNLTVLLEPGQEDLGSFLATQQVKVVASMPCYLQENVDAQRGKGVFQGSITALRRLNGLGYGHDADKVLNLVYNPQGPTLPPAQGVLEQDYKKHLSECYGIGFNRLLTLANMPIQRFGSMLLSTKQFREYMELLHQAHRPANLDSVMCKTTVSVDWQGYLYDCDFNQMLRLPMERRQEEGKGPMHINELATIALSGRSIVVRDHCYGCTAGQGSSCGGALA